jgi:hypothetical protein
MPPPHSSAWKKGSSLARFFCKIPIDDPELLAQPVIAAGFLAEFSKCSLRKSQRTFTSTISW